MEQVQGDKIAFIDEDFCIKLVDGVDGIVTDRKNIYLSVRVADCVPVFLYEPACKMIGVVHSGWKGTLLDVVSKAINLMKSRGACVKNIKCAIGPAICEKCYEVDDKRVLLFKNKFKKLKFDKNHLDLKHIVRHELIESGVDARNIEISEFCTKHDNDKFYSSRGRDKEKRNVGVIAITN